MIFSFAVYDPATGKITGRIRTSSKLVADAYPNQIILSTDEFIERPELTKRVDLNHLQATGQKRLMPERE